VNLRRIYAPVKVLPHLPTKGATRGLHKNFGPRCGDLDNVFNKEGDDQMEKGGN